MDELDEFLIFDGAIASPGERAIRDCIPNIDYRRHTLSTSSKMAYKVKK